MSRLLSLNSYHYRRGGSDVVYLEHDAMFAQAGWQTASMSMNHPSNLPSPWQPYFVDELEFGNDYPWWRKLSMAGKVVWSLEAQRRLKALLDRFPARIAHVHCIYHHLSPSVLPTLKSRGVATVLTAHDLKLACPAYKMLTDDGICERCKGGNLLNVLQHRCIKGSAAASAIVMVESAVHRALRVYRRHVDRVVSPSHFYRAKLIEWGWPPEQITYIPNFVDAAVHQPDFGDDGYLIYFGRLAEEKGLPTLVDAALASGVPLRVVGTGPMQAGLQARAAGAANIRFLGYLAGPPLWQMVRRARAVVIPSQWYENAPMSVLEAFANGKPVLGADIGGIPELIDPGRTGWLFKSGDSVALAEAMRDIVRLPQARLAEMGAEARRHVEQQFSRAGYLERMSSLYRELGVSL